MKKNNELTFNDFKNLAKNPKLSRYEKIGFPNSYRKGKSESIIEDIDSKIPLLRTKNKTVIDIGCGCSDLTTNLIKITEKNGHKLILVDSEEMLNLLPNAPHVVKYAGYFPDIQELFDKYTGRIDYAITYSVFHYIFTESNIYSFIHKTIDLLKNGGLLLIGDIPNISKRRRFLQSEEGVKFQQNCQKFNKRNINKGWTFHNDIDLKIDDAVVLSILMRYRNYGCETYLMPQKDNLPMANRREDILIVKR